MNRARRVLLVVYVAAVLLAVASALAWRSLAAAAAQAPGPGSLAEPPAYPEDELDLVSAYLRVPGSALRPAYSSYAQSALDPNRLGCAYALSGDPDWVWVAPIYPPQGATLTNLRFYVYDTSASEDQQVRLVVLDYYGDEAYTFNGYSSGSSGYGLVDIDLGGHVVDYTNYSYLLNWWPHEVGTAMKICGFNLYYTPAGAKAYMPAVLKDN
jgi:hypothetical protein